MEFSYSLNKKEEVVVINLEGTLNDKGQAMQLLHEVDELILGNSNRFIISMKKFKYINSTGLNILINILTKARKAGGEVVIADVPQKINELLLITKLNTVFTVTGTMEEAISSLK